MAHETIWPIEEHTRAKHELLRRYLEAWFPIMAVYNQRLIFLDGFAGPGVYIDGELGSPLIAIQTLLDHAHFGRWSETEFVFFFVESREARFESLKEELDSFWGRRDGGKPANIRVYLFNDQFATVASEVITAARGHGRQLAPTLAFIDPFGWSGVPMHLIRELLAADKCEVLFNFMYDSVNRFVSDERPGVVRHFDELFGTTKAEYRKALALSGEERKAFLRDLYKRQLHDVGGFPFVRSFEMIDVDRGRTAYFLMFGTRHHKGLEVMENAMWAIDTVAGARFTGSDGNQQVLFSPEIDTVPLRKALVERFAGQSVKVEAIERFVIEEPDYKKTHYKKQVLKVLEEEGMVVCESYRKRQLTYPPGTILRFLPTKDCHDS